MATAEPNLPKRRSSEPGTVVRAVTVIIGTVIGLTFMFGFGNVLNLALHLGVPAWVAPLVAPAVDLSILGLLLGTRHLALNGATPDQLRPARRLLIFASVVTLALNVADPVIAGEYGKAAFDAVGPLLLIGWSEVGPGLLRSMSATFNIDAAPADDDLLPDADPAIARTRVGDEVDKSSATVVEPEVASTGSQAMHVTSKMVDEDLLERAKQENARHWATYQRPISAETLRKQLRIGAARSRMLVPMIRADQSGTARLRSRLADPRS